MNVSLAQLAQVSVSASDCLRVLDRRVKVHAIDLRLIERVL